MNADLALRVCELAGDVFGIDHRAVSDASSPKSIPGWDSLQHVNFILALEDKFQVSFDPQEIDEIDSIGTAVRLLRTKLGQ